jgi:hypothetical protein
LRLIKYINEVAWTRELEDNAIEMLKKDCAPVIKEITKAKKLIYRGASSQNSLITRRRTRMNRRPLNIEIEIHKILDQLFKKKFGWRARSQSITGTSRRNSAYLFGSQVYMLFPIGEYEVIWIKNIGDLIQMIPLWIETFFEEDKAGKRKSNIRRLIKMWSGGVLKHIDPNDPDVEKVLLTKATKELEEIVSKSTSGRLSQALKGAHELMFKCKEYYLVDMTAQEAIENELFGGQLK